MGILKLYPCVAEYLFHGIWFTLGLVHSIEVAEEKSAVSFSIPIIIETLVWVSEGGTDGQQIT